MRNVLKLFGAKGTGSFEKRFERSRFLLTIVYVVLAGVMLFASSATTRSIFFGQLEHRFRPSVNAVVRGDGASLAIIPRAEDIRRDLRETQLVVDALLLISVGLLSYLLAGLTLAPIKRMYERQREFLSDASHELRTPLSILQIELENELREVGSARKKRIESNLEEVERMSALVEGMLALARLEEKDRVLMQAVNVKNMLITEIARMETIASRHGVALSLEGEDVVAKADPVLLSRAVQNILKNAIVYNKKAGTVRVALSSSGASAVITVTDSGIGMDAEELERVFDRFYRVEKSRSRTAGGNGLGLAIARTAIESMGGSIAMKSVPGNGTTVTIVVHRAS